MFVLCTLYFTWPSYSIIFALGLHLPLAFILLGLSSRGLHSPWPSFAWPSFALAFGRLVFIRLGFRALGLHSQHPPQRTPGNSSTASRHTTGQPKSTMKLSLWRCTSRGSSTTIWENYCFYITQCWLQSWISKQLSRDIRPASSNMLGALQA